MKRLLAVGLMVIVLAACSDEGRSDSLNRMTQALCDPAKNVAAGDLRRISLQLPWFPNGEHSYTYLGKELGIFAAHGYDVQIVTGKGSELAARALAAGSVDAAILGGDSLTLVAAEGGAVQAIGAVYDDSPVVIYSLREKGIKKVRDLYGKTLGVMPGSNTVTQFDAFASINRLDLGKVTIVKVPGSNAPSWILASEGKTKAQTNTYMDALVHYEQFEPLGTVEAFKYDPEKFKIIQLRDPKEAGVQGLKIYGMVIAVHEDRFSEEELMHLKQALHDSFACARNDPDSSIDALAKANPAGEFGEGRPNRAFAREQLAMMINFACGGSTANCANFSGQKDALWIQTFGTMKAAKMITREPELNKFRLKVPLATGVEVDQ